MSIVGIGVRRAKKILYSTPDDSRKANFFDRIREKMQTLERCNTNIARIHSAEMSR